MNSRGCEAFYAVACCAFVAATSVGARSEARTIEFAGRTWEVKGGFGGPGPNKWSTSEENVWVDDTGRLHMKIRKKGNAWLCSEIYTQVPLGYGTYRFLLSSNAEHYDPQIVVGLFTDLDDDHETDIELSRWGVAGAPAGKYSVQPWYIAGNTVDFELGLHGNTLTHSFEWRPESIFFQSLYGHPTNPPSPDSVIYELTYTGDSIPVAGAERLYLNFWLYQGVPPANGSDAELIVRDVVFTPAALVAAPVVSYDTTFGDGAGGGLADLEASDDAYLLIDALPDSGDHRSSTIFEAVSTAGALERLDFTIDASADTSAVTATLELYDFEAGRYDRIGTMTLSAKDLRRNVEIATPGRYLRDDDQHVRARVRNSAVVAHRLRIDALRIDGAD